MSGRMLLAALITALGVAITLVNLRDGLTFSFPLLLGVLLLADGILRFSMLTRNVDESAELAQSPSLAATAHVRDVEPASARDRTSSPHPHLAEDGSVGEYPAVARAPTVLHPAGGEGLDDATPDMRVDAGDPGARP
jgi:hypothetical protein